LKTADLLVQSAINKLMSVALKWPVLPMFYLKALKLRLVTHCNYHKQRRFYIVDNTSTGDEKAYKKLLEEQEERFLHLYKQLGWVNKIIYKK
jgi:hypothetical protein